MEGSMDGERSDFDASAAKKRRKKEKAKELKVEEVEEAKRLEDLLFGSLHSPVKILGREAEMVTWTRARTVQLYDGVDDEEERKPAWIDEEEEKAKVNIANVSRLRKLRKEEKESVISGSEYVARLRAQHVKLIPETEWAQQALRLRDCEGSSDEEDNGMVNDHEDTQGIDEILCTDKEPVVKDGAKLLPGLLEYSRLVDANAQEPSNCPINSVQFHRNAQMLLCTGFDRRVRFFQIDGKRNPKVQSIFLEDCPIRKASFSPDGSQVIVSGRRKFFYTFDLLKAKVDKIGSLVGREEKSLEYFEVSPDSSTIAFVGNEGHILLVSSKTKELVGTLKINGTARSLAFVDNGLQLLSFGGVGHVYHWDLQTMTCLHKAVDEGCVHGTANLHFPGQHLICSWFGKWYRECLQQTRFPWREEEAAQGNRQFDDQNRFFEIQQ
ncbi:hypothetical protein MLD38_036039 [Melastoma candidum]|uniref:Uncharacterized protein n=1 Tax=Melastoma candidum TaxID=119954 RepID=A0ACB9LIF3_9MYRT|nr:hypothetical protein MLD38_036039 [Melastoma candidum]